MMARFERDGEPEDEEVKQVKTQLVSAEKTFQKMLEKRNLLNDQARERRSERDSVNEQKKALVAQMRALQGERDAANAEARSHRDRRNEFQKQAKDLLEIKKRTRAAQGEGRGYMGKVRELEREIKDLEFKQQSTAMSIAKENELLKKLGELRKELEEARVKYSEESKLLENVKDLDAKIDELFRAADDEHAKVVEIGNRAQTAHNGIEPILKELRMLDQLGEQKHQEFVALRQQADEIHAKMTEAREKVVGLRDQRGGIFRERRQIIEDQNKAAREALGDPEKLDEAADEAVKLLLEKKRIQL